MAAVFRVKRRLDEEPSEALYLNCKRKKTEENNDSEVSAVLKLAGTVENEENVVSHIQKRKLDLKDEYKTHAINLTEKIRREKQEEIKKSRYKVVNCFRSLDTEDYTIFDIEADENQNDKSTENRNSQCTSSDPKYVYDLYYTNSEYLEDVNLDYVSVCPLDDPLIFGSHRDNGLNDLDSDNESEDSNAENNWRNDYPDESDMDSITEDDMIKAMKKVDIEDDLLSSDDGDIAYCVDDEGTFDEEGDVKDIQRYGKMYAKFKAKNSKDVQTSDLSSDFYCGDIDEEEYYF